MLFDDAPKVLNQRDLRRTADDEVWLHAKYVGRPSEFGNLFIVGRDGDQEECVMKYEAYLDQHPELVAQIKRELRGWNLICWCKPKRCHADIQLRIANGF